MKELLQIQDILNKEVKRGFWQKGNIHLLQETQLYATYGPSLNAQWGLLSVRDSGAHAPSCTHLRSFSTFNCIRYQLK